MIRQFYVRLYYCMYVLYILLTVDIEQVIRWVTPAEGKGGKRKEK